MLEFLSTAELLSSVCCQVIESMFKSTLECISMHNTYSHVHCTYMYVIHLYDPSMQ